jgi:hypothetical protein
LMLKNTSAMNLGALRQDITAVLEKCYSQGMQLPYLFVAVSLDGKLIGVRFTKAEDSDGLDPVPIAGNPNAVATMPLHINVMIVDATGQAACALMSEPGQVTFRYW